MKNQVIDKGDDLELLKLLSPQIPRLREIKEFCKYLSFQDYISYRDLVLEALTTESVFAKCLARVFFDWIEDETRSNDALF